MTNDLIEIVDLIPQRRSMSISATLALRRSRYGLSLPLIFGLGVYALIAAKAACQPFIAFHARQRLSAAESGFRLSLP